MGLEDLIGRLERDAEARLAELRVKTDGEVTRLLAEARAEEGSQQRRELTKRREERRAQLERELVDARQRARAAILEAEHQLLEQIFSKARKVMAEAALPAWYELLSAELERALRYFEGQRVVARCTDDVFEVVKRRFLNRPGLELRVERLPSSGCVLSTLDDSVRVDLTFDTRLARIAPRLAVELLAEVRR